MTSELFCIECTEASDQRPILGGAMMPTIVRCSQREQWGGEYLIRTTLSLRATAEEQMFLMNVSCGVQ